MKTETNESTPASDIASDQRRVLWRDLEIGEYLQDGDRIMQPKYQWTTWKTENARRPIQVTEHTFPAQRRVFAENGRDLAPGPEE